MAGWGKRRKAGADKAPASADKGAHRSKAQGHVIRRRAFVAGSAALVGAAAVGTGTAVRYSSMLNRIVNPSSVDVTDAQREATTRDNEQLAERVEATGAVLLRNEPINVVRRASTTAAEAGAAMTGDTETAGAAAAESGPTPDAISATTGGAATAGIPSVGATTGSSSTSVGASADASVSVRPTELTLPIPESVTRVNVFGWASTDWLGGGSGSGGVKSVDLTFLEALEEAGIEKNPELTAMYEGFQAAREFTATLHSWPEQSSRLYEPDIEDEDCYSQTLLEHALEFSRVAIVVIGRLAGESSDLPEVQYRRTKRGAKIVRDLTRHTLALSREEERLLRYVGANYERVIVVLNCGNVMELGPIETIPGIGACLLAGYTGQKAAAALPQLLWGGVSPTGRTTDTWAYSLKTAASYAHSGKQGVGAYAGAQGLYPADGTSCGNLGEAYNYEQVSYVDYAEGPYVGYRWYETADAEGYWAGVSNEHGAGYEGVVQYPFGYGLSYTSFTWDVVDRPAEGERLDDLDSLSFTVGVTNEGERSGADVVQLYAEVPYTPGQIEKPSLQLVAYARTNVLAAGERQELTLSFALSDLASYDYSDANANGFAGYELDPGDYAFTLRRNAHTPDAAEGARVTCRLRHNRQFPTDPVTGVEVRNRFTGADAPDGAGIDGVDTGQEIAYLTRGDFARTFPGHNDESRTIPDQVADLNLFTKDDIEAWVAEGADRVHMGGLGAQRAAYEGELTSLGRTLGASYDDEAWDSLLNQLKPIEAMQLVCDAYSGTAELRSIGKEATKDADGPAQMGGFTGFSVGTGFPCPWILAQTWNASLARVVGRAIGKQAGQLGYGGWYAPAANLHRSPVGGRNYEYCSEDPLVTGEVAGNMVAGAREAGIFTYVKHLICNDGEAHIFRDGCYTWMTEQTLRELYLRPFQRLVETYGATGMMSSYNRIGAVWAGGSRSLLTDVLRGEWGFRGAVITDYSDHPKYMSGDHALYAGGDLWMAGTQLVGDTSSTIYRQALRRAAKDVLYMELNARVANEAYAAKAGDDSARKPKITGAVPLWPIAVAGIDVVALGLLALATRCALRGRRGGGDGKRAKPGKLGKGGFAKGRLDRLGKGRPGGDGKRDKG